MLDEPIPKIISQYPKDFTPSPCIIRHKKYDYHEVLSTTSPAESLDNNIIDKLSINEVNIFQNGKIKHQKVFNDDEFPLNQHEPMAMPKINSKILKNPRITLKQFQQLGESPEDNLQKPAGIILKQLHHKQQPLIRQQPFDIFLPIKQSQEIIKQTTNRFYDIPNLQKNMKVTSRANSSNLLPSISNSKNDNLFSHSGNKKGNLSYYFQNNQGLKQHSLILKKYQHQNINMQSHEINQLKEEVKNIMNKNKNSKYPIKITQQSEQTESNNHYEKQKLENQSKSIQTNYKLYEKTVSITYKTSLSTLKSIYKNRDKYQLVIKIPGIFTEKIFTYSQSKKQIYNQAHVIYQELGIVHQNLIIKKYSNCVFISTNHLCLIWHYNGRRYLGGWQTQYLDQGFKHGIGLEWYPQKYVYYGQYVRNKRHGLGVMKNVQNEIYIGVWNEGHSPQIYRKKLLKRDNKEHKFNPQIDGYEYYDNEKKISTHNEFFDMDSS